MADNIKKVIEDDGTIHLYLGDLHHNPDGPAVVAFEGRQKEYWFKGLRQVMISWCAKTPVTVTDVISTSMKGVSQSTVHLRLRSQRKMSMITHAVDEIDTRIKYVYPTRHCIEYFNTLAACFNHSVTALI